MQKLQNRAATIVTNSNYDVTASNLIMELNWPTVKDMIRSETPTNIQTYKHTYKALSGLAPGYLTNLFKKNFSRDSSMNLLNATVDVLVPRMKTYSG